MVFFLTFILVSLSPLHPLSYIQIEGNRSFSDEEIVHSLNLSEPFNLTEKTIEECSRRILNLYKSAGFLEAEIHYEIRDSTLILTISEGVEFRVGTIEVKGNKFIKDDVLLKLLSIKKGRVFSVKDFEAGVDEVLNFYGNSGFPFTRFVPSYFKSEKGRIEIGLEVEEGPRLRWGDITAQGNTITKDYVIKKQLRIPTGDYFSENQLSRSRTWLEKLPFIEIEDTFGFVKGEESGTVDLLVNVREVKSNRMSGIIGYIPPREEEKGGYIGSFMTEMLNLFGTGRAIRVQWEKQIPPYTKLDVSFKEPWVFGSQSNLKLSLFHLLEDTLYTFSKAHIEVKTDLSLNLSMSILIGWEKFTPASIEIPASRKYSLGTGVEFSNLDYPVNPRSGVNYIFFTEYGKKGPTNVMKFTLDLLNNIPVFANNAIAILISGKATRTNDPPLPEYEQFTLGGYNSLRGYRERQFRTIQMLRVSPEYRYLVSRNSRLYLFYDCAYFKTSTYPLGILEDYFKAGYGVGARFSGGIGIISIEYALGEEKSFMKAKIHLGLDTAF